MSSTKAEIVLSLESNYSTLRTVLDIYQTKVKECILKHLSLQHDFEVIIHEPSSYNSIEINVLGEDGFKAFGAGITVQYFKPNYSSGEINVSLEQINFPSFAFSVKDEKRNYMLSHLSILNFVANNSIEIEKIMIEMVENLTPILDAKSLLLKEKYRLEKEEKDAIAKTREEEFTTIKIGTKLIVPVNFRQYEVVKLTPKFITIQNLSDTKIEFKYKVEDFKSSFIRGTYELIK